LTTFKVLFLASEADPLIKVGGLGDVAGSLPIALQALNSEWLGGMNLDIRLVIPFHSAIRQKLEKIEQIASFEVPNVNGAITATVFQTKIDELTIYLIAGSPFGAGEPVYTTDSYRDGTKYTFFSLAALALPRYIDWIPDVIHANDWHTAVAPYAAKYSAGFSELQTTPSVLTVHNLPFMGAGAERALEEFFIPQSLEPNLPDWARLIPLPLGLVSADRIVAVSASYAQEILTPEFGCGLESFLLSRQETVTGILNGLDQTSWDPLTDQNIPVTFGPQSLEKRQNNREALLHELKLNIDPKTPLLIIISRMDQQKGIDLAIEALHLVGNLPWQTAILGTGSPLLEASCNHLQETYPDRVRAILKFDANLARRMYAGGDMILMPSRYEPCGLAQMISMRYGCVPVARATGGLKDTIHDILTPGATGFLFNEATAKALAETLVKAFLKFSDHSEWKKLQLRGMQMDFSWQRSALAYAQLYQTLKEQVL
jgi:starch synthase